MSDELLTKTTWNRAEAGEGKEDDKGQDKASGKISQNGLGANSERTLQQIWSQEWKNITVDWGPRMEKHSK